MLDQMLANLANQFLAEHNINPKEIIDKALTIVGDVNTKFDLILNKLDRLEKHLGIGAECGEIIEAPLLSEVKPSVADDQSFTTE